MKKRSLYIVVLSLLLLSVLVVWQIKHLQNNQQLIAQIEENEMQEVLLDCAIELRQAEAKDHTLKNDHARLRNLTEETLKEKFSKYKTDIQWAVYNALGEFIYGQNSDINSTELLNSELKTCLSCLVMIDMLDDDGSNPENRGFTLQQTPAQMKEMRGLDDDKLFYLHIYPAREKMGIKPYSLPILFIFGLAGLFAWLFYLNNKQQKLIQQKNEFVNHLSHQFQTPLSSIKLSANLLAQQKATGQNELVKIIQTESNRLEHHIKTVLHWVKSDADRLQITMNRVGITDVIERSIKQMRPVFETNKTNVQFVPPEKEYFINADENHLQLILFNIWGNAVKHNTALITLQIKVKSENGKTVISTADNGKGINQKRLEYKFKGLGLQYVRRLMLEHKGEMVLEGNESGGLSVLLKFNNNG